MSIATAQHRIDLESPERTTVTISVTLEHRNFISAGAAIVHLNQRVSMAQAELRRIEEWPPDRMLAHADDLDALDVLFPMRSGHVEERARFVPSPRYQEPTDDER